MLKSLLEGDLVVPLEGAHFRDRHLGGLEVEQDRLLDPGVHDPVAAMLPWGMGDSEDAGVEHVDHPLDTRRSLLLRVMCVGSQLLDDTRLILVLPERLDVGPQGFDILTKVLFLQCSSPVPIGGTVRLSVNI